MSGVWEEVYGEKEHDFVPVEKSLGANRENLVAASVRGDASALEEVFGVREITIQNWWCRSGMQGKKLHERFLPELELIHVQLDELWANVKDRGPDMGLWVLC